MQPTQLLTQLIHVITGPTATQEIREKPSTTVRRHPFDDTMHALNRLAARITPFAAGTLLGFIGAVYLDHTASR